MLDRYYIIFQNRLAFGSQQLVHTPKRRMRNLRRMRKSCPTKDLKRTNLKQFTLPEVTKNIDLE